LGKGDKIRVVHFGVTVGQALRYYLRQRRAERDEPLFVASKSGGMLRPMTRSGLMQLINARPL
jgi:site-specific recombinase XerD